MRSSTDSHLIPADVKDFFVDGDYAYFTKMAVCILVKEDQTSLGRLDLTLLK